VPNFAHATSAACEGGLESALHLAAKQLIEDRRELFLPGADESVEARGKMARLIQCSFVVQQAGTVALSEVRVEEALEGIRPDLIVVTNLQGNAGPDLFALENSRDVLVEIAYTHFVDERKLERIRNLGLPAVEIDISDIENLCFRTLSERLFGPTHHSRWVFHPDAAAVKTELAKQLHAAMAADLAQWTARQQVRDAVKKADEETDRRRRDHALHLHLAARADESEMVDEDAQRGAAFAALSGDEKLRHALQSLGIEHEAIPAFLSLKVRAHWTIEAAPRIWQTAVFAALINTAHRRNVLAISADEVLAWMRNRFDVDESRGRPEVAVWDFMSALAQCCVLERRKKQEFLVVVSDVRAAMEVAANHDSAGRHALAWSDEWPEAKRAVVVARVFGMLDADERFWLQMVGL